MRVAFYAPLKPPDHPTPSGDRTMARLLWRVLEEAGHQVSLASAFRSHDATGARQAALREQGRAEAGRLAAALAAAAERPELWLSYHVYRKSPDWLGPEISRRLAIPYVIAEPAHAPSQADGAFALGHRAAAEAIAAAQAVLCMTRLDAECVAPLLAPGARLFLLPPFLDHLPLAAAGAARARHRADLARRHGLDPARRWLLAVAMMRPGDKLASYRLLAETLGRLEGEDWQALVVGDGPARDEVAAAFAGLVPARARFLGAVSGTALNAVYGAADLYLWPAVAEAYGMAFLEAQAAGVPVIAGRLGGVPEVVRDGVSGVLVAPYDAGALAAATRRLLDDGAGRRRLGEAARALVAAEHSLAGAAAVVGAALDHARAAGLVAAS